MWPMECATGTDNINRPSGDNQDGPSFPDDIRRRAALDDRRYVPKNGRPVYNKAVRFGAMAELADAGDLKSPGVTPLVGSIPTRPTRKEEALPGISGSAQAGRSLEKRRDTMKKNPATEIWAAGILAVFLGACALPMSSTPTQFVVPNPQPDDDGALPDTADSDHRAAATAQPTAAQVTNTPTATPSPTAQLHQPGSIRQRNHSGLNLQSGDGLY